MRNVNPKLKNTLEWRYWKYLAIGAAFLIATLVFFGMKLITKNSVYFYNVEFPNQYNQMLTVKAFNYIFPIKPLNASASSKILSGDKIKYIDVFNNTDVVQTILTNKLKEEIVLKAAGHPEEFQYQIDLTNFDFKKEPNGDIFFYEKGNEQKIIFILPAPFMIDVQGKKSSLVEVETTITGEGILTIRPNADWLKNAAYPVILDPTIEINILNVHSRPQTGENWEVFFTTLGQADLRIIPNDEATIDDDEFISLSCGEQNIQPQILKGDVIFVPNWQCGEQAKVVHYTKKAGKHTLKFDFGGQIAYAYNTSTWYNSSWAYRQAITLQGNKISTTTSAFPVLASTTQTVLKTTANGGKVGNANGYDIVFTDSDGTTLLNYEREKYASTTGEIAYWISTNIASSTNKTIYMYYGNAGASDQATTTGVWDTNFKGVWHLKETDIDGGAGDIKDSTANGNNGATSGMDTSDQVTGQIDGSFDFDGINDYVGTPLTLPVANSGTVTAWVKFDDFAAKQHHIVGAYVASPLAYFWMGSNGNYYNFAWGGAGTDFKSGVTLHGLSLGQWYHFAMVRTGTASVILYVNGSQRDSFVPSATAITSLAINIGNINGLGGFDFDGLIDEVRISNVARSVGWITTEYNNQSNMATFMTFGAEESGVVEQEGFRWRSDDGNETTATWLANQDTNITSDNNINLRLRVLINGVIDPASTQYQLEYRKMGESAYRKVLTSSATEQIIMSASPNISVSGDNTTAQLTAPSGKTTGDFVAGRMQDDENPADAVDITANNYTELEWSIKATDKALNYDVYQFRVTSNGTVFDAYSVTPQLTISGTPRTVVNIGAGKMKVNTPTSNYYTSGLVGNWSFDGQDTTWTSATAGTTNDLSGNNNTGTMTNMSRSFSPAAGISGQALNFDGVDDGSPTEVIVSDPGASSILDFANGSSITLSAWVRPDIITGDRTIISKRSGSSNTDTNYAMRASDAKFDFYYRDSGDTAWHVWRSTNNVFNANQWTHVIVTYTFGTGNTVVLYINGTSQAGSWLAGDGNSAPLQNNVPVLIGVIDSLAGAGYEEVYDGLIDEVRIYNRALTPSEITDLYNLGARKVKFKQ